MNSILLKYFHLSTSQLYISFYELSNGNKEFSITAKTIEDKLNGYGAPEVKYFMDVFVTS